ncbi:MAG: hypothetical protein ACE5FG_03395 [Myxococcota bacterium]
MTIRQRSDTAARPEGFDARLEAAFAWVADHWMAALGVVGGLLVTGGIVAGAYEYRQRTEDAAQVALAQVENRFVRAMGGDVQATLISEPANPELARTAREEALAEYDEVAIEHGGTRAADLARLRAAEMEVGLGHWNEGQRRLAELAAELDAEDPLRAVALRLRGYVLEQQGRFADAGEAYAEAAAVRSYPARGSLWMTAGEAYARAGQGDLALDAFQEALAADPELAEQAGVVDRLSELSVSR